MTPGPAAPGLPLSDPAALTQPGLNRKMLADAVIRGFLAQALDHGVFHADLHEGNLFVAPPAVLTAVDFGIIGRLGKNERRYLAEILYGFLERDYHKVAKSHFEAGYVVTPQDIEAMDYLDALMARPEFQLHMEMRKGDVQFVNNFTVMHARTEYRDGPTRKRHLVRYWIDVPHGKRKGFTTRDLYVRDGKMLAGHR